MVLQIRPAKYVPETISYFVDFSDQFQPGESISGSPVITVSIVDGEDSNPSAMLYQGSFISGNIVEQRIRQGIAGCIYSIVFQVSTNLGNTFEKEFYLAILPSDGNAIPDYQPVWLTTFPYPYYWFESLVPTVSIPYASSLYNPSWTEALAPNVLGIMWANLYGGAVTYNNPHEDLTASPVIIFTNLYGGLETYNYFESLDTQVALIWANLYGGAITYDNPHEDLTATPTIILATLS